MTHPSTVADTLDAGHTPGPWFEQHGILNGGHILIVGDRDYGVAKVYDHDRGMEAVNAANARLIAAAPELLEALELVLNTYGFDSSTDSSIWATVIAAIAKARGEVQP